MDSDIGISPDPGARRLALEVIATLVHVKKLAAEQLLRRAEVPEDLIRRFVTDRDPATGEKRSKREAGAVLLDELAKRGAERAVIRRLIDIAAGWTAFHLAQDEYHARAVVQKAGELHGAASAAEANGNAPTDAGRNADDERRRRERQGDIARQSALLLAQFEESASSGDHQKRGYLLEDLLNRTFDLHGIPVVKPFRRNGGGEQIDAAFEFDGWHYLVECRWRERLADIRQLDGLAGQVARSGRQTMGLFVSVEGWSPHVVPLLKQNPDKSIFLMEGFDLRTVLDRRVELRRLLKAKLSALNLEAEPYFSVANLLKEAGAG